tara:strand:- start:13287 stop:13982 length:696 start_codon:yes stop_codon:yes gene_type:complete
MSLQSILIPLAGVIPDELTLRNDSSMKAVGFGFFIAFIFIAITKLIKSDVFVNLGIAFLKQRTLEQYLKESYSLFELHSIMQIINYWLSFSLLLYVFFELPGFNNGLELTLVIFTPLVWFLLTILGLLLTSALSGESKNLYSLVYFKIIGTQFLGLTFFVAGSLWFLTPINENTLALIIIILLSTEFIFRLIKSLFRILEHKVSWYYIILYFCTLEILPLLIGFRLYMTEF